MDLISLIVWRTRLSIFALFILGGFVTSVYWLYDVLEVLVQSGIDRHQSYLLADELRQSSDDLTRMVRTFAATGDKRFEKQFYNVLAIRKGEQPRPPGSHQIYWDLKTHSQPLPTVQDEMKSLHERIIEQGMAEDEMALLNEAHTFSDSLVALETMAMNAINDQMAEADKKRMLPGESRRDFALRILHGPAYHDAKEKIMMPIQTFLQKMDARTEESYNQNASQAFTLFAISIGLLTTGSIVIILLFLVQKAISRKEHVILEEAKTEIEDVNTSLYEEIARRRTAEEKLEKRVSERTRELEKTIRALHDSKISLERQAVEIATLAHEESTLNAQLKHEVDVKNKFFSIVAHDLKSPFTALLGMSQLMSQMSDSFTKEKFVEYATAIHTSGENLFALVQNLLEWSRLQVGAVEIEPALIPLGDMTEDTIKVLKPVAEEKGVTLHINVNNDYVFADRYSIETVIRNLVANAIKFTPSGGSITLASEQKGKMMEISVSDTGVGMTQDQIESVFDIDQKTSTRGTDGEVGTGLGLPLCRDLLIQNNGRIWVESVLKEGTTFKFLVPSEPSA